MEDVIRFADLEEEVNAKRETMGEEIVARWEKTLTREYIKEKIVHALANDKQGVTLIKENTQDSDSVYCKVLFINSNLEETIRALLEPDVYLYTTTEGKYFCVGLAWHSLAGPSSIRYDCRLM